MEVLARQRQCRQARRTPARQQLVHTDLPGLELQRAGRNLIA
jgi:hypothetical protein